MLPYAMTWNFGVQHVSPKTTLWTSVTWYTGCSFVRTQRLKSSVQVTPSVFLPTYLTAPSTATLAALPFTLAGYHREQFSPVYRGSTEPVCPGKHWELFVQRIGSGINSALLPGTCLFKAAYTWSHKHPMTAPPICSRRISRHGRPQDSELAERENQLILDRRHRFTYNAVYDRRGKQQE